MPFTFKLSKRLALMKASLVPAAAAVLAACQLQDRRGTTGPTLPSNSVVQVVIVPDTVTLEPSQALQFLAYGRTEAGDSTAITMTWSATDGAISSGGLYTASPFQGDYQVTATLLQTSASARPAPVRLRACPDTLLFMSAPTRGWRKSSSCPAARAWGREPRSSSPVTGCGPTGTRSR